jgi:hypothetical protein
MLSSDQHGMSTCTMHLSAITDQSSALVVQLLRNGHKNRCGGRFLSPPFVLRDSRRWLKRPRVSGGQALLQAQVKTDTERTLCVPGDVAADRGNVL